jgi:hypothetical protein
MFIIPGWKLHAAFRHSARNASGPEHGYTRHAHFMPASHPFLVAPDKKIESCWHFENEIMKERIILWATSPHSHILNNALVYRFFRFLQSTPISNFFPVDGTPKLYTKHNKHQECAWFLIVDVLLSSIQRPGACWIAVVHVAALTTGVRQP